MNAQVKPSATQRTPGPMQAIRGMVQAKRTPADGALCSARAALAKVTP
jgi:hypothetical protein